ncbi:MAG: ribonuclease J [Actinobacteria bacterium]|nr:ribonuclease J [Actinomycetota bacterium]
MADPVRLAFLGGLGEIGRNCAVLEVANRLLVIDCGLLFPNPDMPGVDLVLPEFTYLKQNSDRLEGCVLTHGHEDHTGALAYLLEQLDLPRALPVWGSRFTLGIAGNRVEEAGLARLARMIPLEDGQRFQAGPFDIETIPVTHSVPHGFALAFHTPQGVILHTGDFKLDPTPVDGRRTNLSRIGALAALPGVRLLLSDSTNADEPGYTESESSVGIALRRVLDEATGKRVVVTCFASHIHRIQQVINAATDRGRLVATLGRSMGKNVALARSLGLLSIPEGSLVDIDEVEDLDPGKVCVLSTGSQGEPMSALTLMAAGESKWLDIAHGDVVVISAHAIPGNEWAVSTLIDDLYRRGAEVVYTERESVHTSGHARQGELATMLTVASPEWFVPVHGEYRHLVNHSMLAQACGVRAERVLICGDGDVIVIDDHAVRIGGSVPAAHVFVDGVVGDVGHGVLRDRMSLAEEGVVFVVVGVDETAGEVVTGPEVVSRGWVHGDESEELLEEVAKVVAHAVSAALRAGTRDHDALRREVRKSAGRIVSQRTRRRPMIVPVVLGV